MALPTMRGPKHTQNKVSMGFSSRCNSTEPELSALKAATFGVWDLASRVSLGLRV